MRRTTFTSSESNNDRCQAHNCHCMHVDNITNINMLKIQTPFMQEIYVLLCNDIVCQ